MNNQKGKSIVRYTCNHCFKTWRQKDSFHKHLKICKGKGSAAATAPKYHCNKCTITFACRRSFRKHKCKKISQQINTCHFCNKQYTSQVYFNKHIEMCGKRSKWLKNSYNTCPYCKKIYHLKKQVFLTNMLTNVANRING